MSKYDGAPREQLVAALHHRDELIEQLRAQLSHRKTQLRVARNEAARAHQNQPDNE